MGHETTEAGETGEAADDDTPAYGFPVVTEQDAEPRAAPDAHPARRAGPGRRTRLSGPGRMAGPGRADSADGDPADMADPAELAGPVAADPAAKGKPPAASAELPVTEAELAHEDQPDQEPTAPAQSTPPETAAPARFERVRSTPRPPAE